jgi:two-component system cell cycle sensor histidine kinase/response regulator CckA
VLVAEDEATLRLLVERILKRMGLRVLTAEDGAEAVELFRHNANDITFVILDFTMPRLDGIKTLEALRVIQPEVTAVLTSGYDVENIHQRYAQEGFAAFIRKPFQVETLMKVVRQLCPRLDLVARGRIQRNSALAVHSMGAWPCKSPAVRGRSL